MIKPLRSRDVVFGTSLRFPWVIALLVACCVLVTAPSFVEPRRFFLTLGVGFCDEDGPVHWWHYLVTPFVHGRGVGCGFPPTWFHLAINVALFAFQGALVERLLGAGRTALLTLTCFAVQIPLRYWLVDGRAHGASGMTWSYLLFVLVWLRWSFGQQRWSMLRDWVTLVLVLLSLFAILGLIKHWHLWNLLVSLPFFLAWRKTLTANIERAARGDALELGLRRANAAGVAVTAALLAFNLLFVGAALAGWVEPQVVSNAQEHEG
jgi:hypothetical protein